MAEQGIGTKCVQAGYTPGKTATVATEVYQLWRIGDDGAALRIARRFLELE